MTNTPDTSPTDTSEEIASNARTLIFLRVSKDDTTGSYGAVVREGFKRWGVGSRQPDMTPNAMEIIGASAVLRGILDRRGPSDIDIVASRYLAANSKRITGWREQEWQRRADSPFISRGSEIVNPDLWSALDDIMRKHLRVIIRFMPSTGSSKRYWQDEREAARLIAKSSDAAHFKWTDISAAFGLPFNPALLNPDNDNFRARTP